jgi:hypothetical protein
MVEPLEIDIEPSATTTAVLESCDAEATVMVAVKPLSSVIITLSPAAIALADPEETAKSTVAPELSWLEVSLLPVAENCRLPVVANPDVTVTDPLAVIV